MGIDQEFDLIVIGSGPGGYVAAIRASQLKMKVALIEKERLGGVCLNWGCIPSKALLKSAELFQEMKTAGEFGIQVSGLEADFSKVVQRSREVADVNSKGVEFLMKKNKVEVIFGKAEFLNSTSISVKDASGTELRQVSAKKIIIATGARTRALPNLKPDGKHILGYREAIVREKKPESALVIGAGAIGMEFAYVWNSFGSKVSIVEYADRIIPLEDTDSSKAVAFDYKKMGIELLTGAMVTKVEVTDKGIRAQVKSNKDASLKTIEKEVALLAAGVEPNTEGLNLEKLGLKLTDRGFIEIDHRTYQTSIASIYAIGDVAGPPMLAHKASLEAINCVENLSGHANPAINMSLIPKATYCQPQIASVGLSEEEAKAKGYTVQVGKFPFQASGKARAIGHTSGFVKVIVDAKYGELLGTHIVGHDATEMIAEATLAQRLESVPELILKTSHAHPTLSEAFMEAVASAKGEAIHI